MKIGLYGIFGLYNFGCEAIVRGSFNLIKSLYPDSEIIYYSYYYEYDREILKDIEIDVREIKISNNIFKKVCNRFLSLIRYEKRFFMFDYKNIFNEIDMLFSIGGDIYTIPSVDREKKKYNYYNQLIDFCERARKNGIKTIVYGASIGPFGNYKRAISYYRNNLKKYHLIICREQTTIDYLTTLDVNNTYLLSDPAFSVRKTIQDSGHKEYVGLNLSPLSLNQIYGSIDDKEVEKLADIFIEIYQKLQIPFLLIPHVISPYKYDNDRVVLDRIAKRFDQQRIEYIYADTCEGFLGVKNYLNKCHFVICARMHCGINAIVENVPAIFLSYSSKTLGISRYIYGNEQYVVPINALADNLIELVCELDAEKTVLINKLEKRNQEIYENTKKQIPELFALLEDSHGSEN